MPGYFNNDSDKVFIEFEDHSEDSGSRTSYSFVAQAFGAESVNRYVVAALAWMSNTGDRTISSISIGGVAASILESGNNAGRGCAICIAAIPTGTSGDVDVTFSGACLGATCATYKVTGFISGNTATSSANDPTATLDIAANGGLIAVAQARAGAAPTTSWTNATENCDDTYVTFNQRSTASATNDDAVSSLVVTATFTATLGSFGVFVTFEPS